MFSRSSKEPGSRKKLSKRGSASDVGEIGRLDWDHAANPQRQDSGSFINLDMNDPALPTYEDVTGLPPHALRDNPYAVIGSVTSTNRPQLPVHPDPAEYRRSSEAPQQYASHLYGSRKARSASVPVPRDGSFNKRQQRSSSEKVPPSKLSKVHRAPTKPVRADDILDKDTGERRDLTDMMHAFTFVEGMDTLDEEEVQASLAYDPSLPDGTPVLGSASPEIWLRVADYLTSLDVANLASTCRTMYARLGGHSYRLFLNPLNRSHRLEFLLAMDSKLPHHLFCFPCAQWHRRIQPGFETLKPHNVLNPLFDCPNSTNVHAPPPRIRISDGRTLPFTFAQLARRAWAYGPEFGVSHQSLARRWKDAYSAWAHESMYHVTDKGHLLMRVRSQHYVQGGMKDAAKRLLLYSRGDYIPYFSVCAHWKHGVLMSVPKCALDHIPFATESETYALTQLRAKKTAGFVSLCNHCRPMRRCPECPTEYLFELKLVEDKTVRGNVPERFKQALVVTRWSDLGPARSPTDPEWSAISGENTKYDSFAETGKRAISGVFESAFTDTVPGQRIMSMNPEKVVADEEGGAWY